MLTSSQISGIIAQQEQSFSQQRSMSSEISPTGPAPAVNEAMMATSVGSYTAKIPGFMHSTAGLMATMNMGPGLLDPFSAAGSFAATGLRVGGWAGGLGYGAVGFGVGSAIQAPIAHYLSNMATGAESRGILNSQVSAMMPGMGASDVGTVSGAIMNMHRAGHGSMNDLTMLLSAGSSQLNKSSAAALATSFQSMMGVINTTARDLGSSPTEAFQALSMFRSAGIGMQDASSVIGTMGRVGNISGLSPMALSEVAMQGAGGYRAAGLNPTAGAMSAVLEAGMMQHGANLGMGGLDEGSSGRLMQGANRFLTSRPGNQVLAAMMDSRGNLDLSIASQIATGTMSKADIMQMSKEKLSTAAGRNMFSSNFQELATKFTGEFGSAGAFGGLKSMTEGSDMQDSLMQSLTRLGSRDLGAMEQLASQGPALKARMMSEAQQGFNAGSGRRSIGDILSKIIEPISNKIRDHAQKIGESWTQSVHETIEGLADQFMGKKGGTGQSYSFSDYDQIWRGATHGAARAVKNDFGPASSSYSGMGNPATSSGFASMFPSLARIGTVQGAEISDLPMFGMGTLSHSDTLNAATMGFAANSLVTGAQAAWNGGTSFLGGGTSSMFMNKNNGLLGEIGSGIGRVGHAISDHFKPEGIASKMPEYKALMAQREAGTLAAGQGSRLWQLRASNFAETWLGGKGLGRGLGAMAGATTKAAGWGLRAAGKLAVPLGAVTGTYDLLANDLPTLMRAGGLSEQVDGGIAGDMSRYIQANEEDLVRDRAVSRRSLFGMEEGAGINAVAGFISDARWSSAAEKDLDRNGDIPVIGSREARRGNDSGVSQDSQLFVHDAERLMARINQDNATADKFFNTDGKGLDRSNLLSSIRELSAGSSGRDQQSVLDAIPALAGVQDIPLATRKGLLGAALTGSVNVSNAADVATFKKNELKKLMKLAPERAEADAAQNMLRNDPGFASRAMEMMSGIGPITDLNSRYEAADKIKGFLSKEMSDSSPAEIAVISQNWAAGGMLSKKGTPISKLIEKQSSSQSVLPEDALAYESITKAHADSRVNMAYLSGLKKNAGTFKDVFDRAGYGSGLGGQITEAMQQLISVSKEDGSDLSLTLRDYTAKLNSLAAGASPKQLYEEASRLEAGLSNENLSMEQKQLIVQSANQFRTRGQVQDATNKYGKKGKSRELMADILGGQATNLSENFQKFAEGKLGGMKSSDETQMMDMIEKRYGTMTSDERKTIYRNFIDLASASQSGDETLIKAAQDKVSASTATHVGGSRGGPAAQGAVFDANIARVNSGLTALAAKLEDVTTPK